MGKSAGEVAPAFAPVRRAFDSAQETDPGAAQLAVFHHGELVVDLWSQPVRQRQSAFDGTSVSVIMSVTKALTALCVHMLNERGDLDIEAPISAYWPEFGTSGKAQITVSDALAHRAGLSHFDPGDHITRFDLTNWNRCVTSLAKMAPLWQPRGGYAYHGYTFGFLLGEVVRRVSGQSIGHFFQDNVASLLDLDLWIGLPESQAHRVFSTIGEWPQPTRAEATNYLTRYGVDPTTRVGAVALELASIKSPEHLLFMNDPATHAAEIPAANGIGNARSVAKMFAAMIGPVEGVRLLTTEAVNRARDSQTDSLEAPLPLQGLPQPHPLRFGLGFELSRSAEPQFGPGSFGHAGSGGRLAFAHPESGLAVAYLCTNIAWVPGGGPDSRWLPWTAALHEVVGSLGGPAAAGIRI